MRDVNLETITDTLSWFRILPLNGFNLISAKQRLHKRQRRVYEGSSSRGKSQQLVFRIIHWSLANLLKMKNGIIELQHLIDPRHGTSAVLLQSGLDERRWADSMECHGYLRNVQDLLADGETPYERRFGEPFKGPLIPFGSMVEYHPTSAQDQSRLHQFVKKVLPEIFLWYALIAMWIWKGDILIADLLELQKLAASEIYSRRINAKEVLISQKGEEFIFPVADGTVKLSGRAYEFREPTPWREQTVRSEELSGGLQGEPGKS